MSAVLAEFVGTALLVLMGNGVVANVVLDRTKGNSAGWIVITAGWAFAVFTAVMCTAELSGAHLNPAVTIGLAVAGGFSWDRVAGYLIAQFAGAFVGALSVYLYYFDHYRVTSDADAKMATFCTSPAIRNLPMNFIAEVIGTLVLVLAVLSSTNPILTAMEGAVGSAKVGLGSIGAIPVAIIVFAVGLSLGGTTGYAINPARDLSPRLVHQLLPIRGKRDSDWGYAWIPVAGPFVGAILAVALHQLMNAK